MRTDLNKHYEIVRAEEELYEAKYRLEIQEQNLKDLLYDTDYKLQNRNDYMDYAQSEIDILVENIISCIHAEANLIIAKLQKGCRNYEVE